DVMQKTGYRYRQTDLAAEDAGAVAERAGALLALTRLCNALLAAVGALAAWIDKTSRAVMRGIVRIASALPMIGMIVRNYAMHYDGADRNAEKLSRRVSGFFGRWSIKFSAEYYEAKDRAEAAKDNRGERAESAAASGQPVQVQALERP